MGRGGDRGTDERVTATLFGHQAASPAAPLPGPSLERRFQEEYFRDNIGYVRAAHVLAIGAWAFFGLFMAPERGHAWYLAIFTIAIVVTAVSLGLSFSRADARWWQRPIVALVVFSAVLSELHRMVTGHPANWGGVVGLILILALAYTLLRLQYPYARRRPRPATC